MAVSLVSTGVQFPDSTIQTTAAGGGTYVFISTTVASAATQVNLTGFDSTYDTYIIDCPNISTSTSITLGARFFNSGTIHTGTYRSQGVAGGAAHKTSDYMEITPTNFNYTAGVSAPLRVIVQRNIDNSRSSIFFTMAYTEGGGYYWSTFGSAVVQAAINVSGIRFYDAYAATANCLSGTFKLYGVKKS